MIVELIVLSLAASILWELFRYFIPLNIPVRIAPIIVLILSAILTIDYNSHMSHHMQFILALSVTAGVAIFHRITGDDSLPALKLKLLRRKENHEIPLVNPDPKLHKIKRL